MRSDIARLEEEAQEYREHELQLQSQIDEIQNNGRSQLAAAKSGLESARMEAAAKLREINTLKRAIQELTDKVAAESTLRLRLATANDDLRADLAVANTTLSASNTRSRELELSLDALRAETAQMKSDNELLQSVQVSTEADLERSKAALAASRVDLVQSLAERKSLESRNSSLQAQLLAVNEDLECSREELANAVKEKEVAAS